VLVFLFGTGIVNLDQNSCSYGSLSSLDYSFDFVLAHCHHLIALVPFCLVDFVTL
jgi:hypothetical protein